MVSTKTKKAKVARKTSETSIEVEIALDGDGKVKVKTPYGFIDHMLTAMAGHGAFDLSVMAAGDVEVDAHHTFEDLGLTMGEAFAKALGDKKGVTRFGAASVPMDEALARAVVDLSGRPYLVYQVEIPERERWEFDVNLVKEFFQAFASSARITLHLSLEYGDNYHHCLEAVFKAAGRALRQAVAMDPRMKGTPSTKGTLK
jgi:imidazoleglycerol-phosphate dehydratase